MYTTNSTLEVGRAKALFPTVWKAPKIKFSYQTKLKGNQLPEVKNSEDAYNVFKSQWDKKRIGFVEQFKLMLLNRANRVIGILTLSSGGTVGTVVEPKLVLAAAISCNASSTIIAHNHPSGNLKPSQADIESTTRIMEGGKIFGIELHDHIIVTCDGHYSFAGAGLI